MVEHTYKQGDKIEFIEDYEGYKVGDVFEVLEHEIGRHTNGVVFRNDNGEKDYCFIHRVRPYADPTSEFKVGDKVYVDFPKYFESGRVYTIRRIGEDDVAWFEDSNFCAVTNRLTHANVSKSSLNLTVGLRGGESMKEITDELNKLDAVIAGAERSVTELRRLSDELRNKLAQAIVVEPNKPKELTRGDVVQMAKDYVESKIDSDGEVEFAYDGFTSWKSPEFIVNEEKRTVVVLLRGIVTGRVYVTGKSKASEGDVFNVHIGKAIALAKALGEEVPEEFVNAPQPERSEVGMVTRSKKYPDTLYGLASRAPEFDGAMGHGRAFYHDESFGWIGENQIEIINDSNVNYEGGK